MDTPDMSIPLPQNPALQDFLVEYAVYQFNRLDKYLLDVRIDEMCMCARVAFYVQAWLWIHHYMQYSVDVEYNGGRPQTAGREGFPAGSGVPEVGV